MQKINHHIIFSIVMLIIGIGLLVYSYIFGADTSVGEHFGPMFYPRIVLWVWIFMALGLTIENLKTQKTFPQICMHSLVLSIISITVCCIILPYLGFFITCLLFCLTYPILLGYRRISIVIPSAIIFTVSVWYIFSTLLHIAIPEGLIG